MKKIVICIMALCLTLTLIPLQSVASATNEPSSLVVTKPPDPVESSEAKALISRLDEINAMDMSKLKSSEKKEMRKEVRSIKRELRELGSGVYVSVGAIIIIALLLIILL
jgi:hypothetical protein